MRVQALARPCATRGCGAGRAQSIDGVRAHCAQAGEWAAALERYTERCMECICHRHRRPGSYRTEHVERRSSTRVASNGAMTDNAPCPVPVHKNVPRCTVCVRVAQPAQLSSALQAAILAAGRMPMALPSAGRIVSHVSTNGDDPVGRGLPLAVPAVPPLEALWCTDRCLALVIVHKPLVQIKHNAGLGV